MSRKTAIGLLAVVGIWLTAGVSLPLVNILKMFEPEQLLVARGFLTAILTFALIRSRHEHISGVDRYAYLIAPCVAGASLGLYKAVRIWGANPAVIIITATPLVNFFITWRSGRKVPARAILSLILLLTGVAVARWECSFSRAGFAWICFATVCNGLLYELFNRTTATKYQQCFWGSVGIGTIGLISGIHYTWEPLRQHPQLWLALGGLAFVHGFVYWMSNVAAFDLLPSKDIASILAQGETPVTIIFAGVLLGESLTAIQWIGVSIALVSAWQMMHWIKHLEKEPGGSDGGSQPGRVASA